MSAPPVVMLVYGAAFFILGIAILIYPKHESKFAFANDLWLVALFGLIHGINEWIDLLIGISVNVVETTLLEVVGAVILPVSYLLLIAFGISVLYREFESRWLWPLSFVLVGAWAGAIFVTGPSTTTLDIWSRYLFGTSGPLLTAYALWRQRPAFESIDEVAVTHSITLMALGFGFYGLFTGLVVPAADFPPASMLNYASFASIVGVPVQVFRAGCAVVAAYGSLRALNVFDWETRKELMEREQRFRQITERSYDAIVILDADRQVRYASPAVEHIHGIDPSAFVGTEFTALLPEDHQFESILDRVESGETIQGTEVSADVTDDERVPVEVNATPIMDNGEVDGVQLVYRDISDRKHREQLRIINRILSHDIRNDMGVISGWAEIIRDDLEDDNVEYIDHIIDRSDDVVMLTDIAGDFLDAAAHGGPELKAVDLEEVLTRNIERCLDSYEEATVRAESIPAVEVEATDALTSVFCNLLDNAIQHNDSENPTVEIDATLGPETVTVRVADNGPGIPDDMKADIFEEGQQAGHGDGTGIGLYLVETLVEYYDGSVTVSDNEPRGSVFEVELQRADSDT